MTKKRQISLERNTAETNIKLSLNVDGKGEYKNHTGIPFFDHMLDLLSKHSLIDLQTSAADQNQIGF